jgi:hypothetical protein
VTVPAGGSAPRGAAATGIRARYLVIALAPIPLALAVGITGLILSSRPVLYVSIAISLIAMPIGGFALARMFNQLTASGAGDPVSRPRSPGSS